MLREQSANIITCVRILGTIVMIFTANFSRAFFVAYTIAGVSDVLDGMVARRLGISSDFGAKLDSAADLLFFISMMVKMFPTLLACLPRAVIHSIISIFAGRVVLYAVVWKRDHKMLANHTILNKVTGLMMFFIPYLIRLSIFVIYATVICIVAVISLIYEIGLVRKQGSC